MDKALDHGLAVHLFGRDARVIKLDSGRNQG